MGGCLFEDTVIEFLASTPECISNDGVLCCLAPDCRRLATDDGQRSTIEQRTTVDPAVRGDKAFQWCVAAVRIMAVAWLRFHEEGSYKGSK